MKKIAAIIFLIFLITGILGITAFAEENLPYVSYSYDSHFNPIEIPAPYTVKTLIKGADLGIGNFNDISDVFFSKETGHIYVADSGNNRIVILNKDYTLFNVLSEFDNNGKSDCFNRPSGITVRNGVLYVADTQNNRIVLFNSDFTIKNEFTGPKLISQPDNYEYYPVRMGVDLANRMYVIATNINNGIILLNENGEFEKYAGSPLVKINFLDKLWKSIMTKQQKKNSEKSVPTEYSSIHIDKDGFLYLTNSSSDVNPVVKLNSQGGDILKYKYNPSGDSLHRNSSGKYTKSVICDVAVRDDGVYAALDSKSGRVFVYDQEGTLLYCFSGMGSQTGMMFSPSAIEICEDQILISDRFDGTLTVFYETTFGKTVDMAASAMLKGDYQNSEKLWKSVNEFCPSYEIPYIELAKIDILEQDYSSALKKLYGAGDIDTYSKAFEGRRKELLKSNFNMVYISLFCILGVIIASVILMKKFRVRQRLEKVPIIKEYLYANYCMFHPIDGFWDIKREHYGSRRAANALVIIFCAVYVLRVQFTGYIFSGQKTSEVNAVFELLKILIPILLWCVSNWCFTTLMDGEGSMKDIYIATAYALRPYILFSIPLCILSNVLSADEAFIYNTLNIIVIIWTVALIFLSMVVTHDYSMKKGLLTALLTILGICLILFLCVVFSNVFQNICTMFGNVYKELVYRVY